MSTGSVDERIRTVLDLGDSSAAVKGLDAEVEKLLAAFKAQTELFEQKKLSPQQYADALHKVKSEVSGLTSAMKELGGGGGGGVDFEGVNRKLFALERGMTSMVEGTGLGRAGGMLESGMSLFGGPAGLGIMAASILTAIDQIAPKIKNAWDGLFKQFSQEDVTTKIAELKGYQTQLAAQVKALLDRPVPGTEDLEATRQKHLGRIFNVGTMTGPEGISHGLVQALKKAAGAVPSELTPEEKQELDKYWAKLHPKEQAKKMWEQAGTTGVIMQMWDEISNLMEIDKSGQQIFDQKAKEGMNKILHAAVQRTVGKLMVDAQKPGKEGRDALTLLKDLATRFPEAFKGGLAQEIDRVLGLSHQIQDLSEQSHTAAAVIHHPGATDLQREQEIEAMEQGRTGGRRQQERRQRQMFERDVMQRMMDQQGLKMSDPNQRALMEHQAADEWRMAMGGPHKRSQQERLERDMAARQRTIELMHDHPEMTFDEAETQARRETTRRERAAYPERFRRGRQQRQSRPHRNIKAGTPDAARFLRQPGPGIRRDYSIPPRHDEQEWEQERERERNVTRFNQKAIETWKKAQKSGHTEGPEAQRAKAIVEMIAATATESPEYKKIAELREQIHAIRTKQVQALHLEEQGLRTHAKTQQVVLGLEYQIGRLMRVAGMLDKNADDMVRRQQKSSQNTTGNP